MSNVPVVLIMNEDENAVLTFRKYVALYAPSLSDTGVAQRFSEPKELTKEL
jgi:hypothetical protein